MITFEAVDKIFKTGFAVKQVHAVRNMSFSVNRGEIFGIIGLNGAGKSTLLKMMMGFIRPTSGEISVMGKSPEAQEIRRGIGYLPENPYFYDHLSAEDLMLFSGTTSGFPKKQLKKNINSLLKSLNLNHARKRKLRSYSKGMTQRAGLCFALVHDPELIVLDEPMSGLDPVGRKLVVDLILDLKKQNKTILFCSHILNDVERLCDRMAIMDQGYLKTIVSHEEIKAKHSLVSIRIKASNKINQNNSLKTISDRGGIIADNNGEIVVTCSQSDLFDTMSEIKNKQMDIINIAPEINTLEKIFLSTIDAGETL